MGEQPSGQRTLSGFALLKRFVTPSIVVTAYYLLRARATVSHRAEVDLTPNLKLGRGTKVSSFTKIKAFGGPVEVGPRSGFAIGCFVSAGTGGIRIGRNFVCGPNVNIVASNYRHDRVGVHFEDQGSTSKGIRIGDNVWIGSGTTVLDGAVIGDNCIVVANSLVNRRFPDNAIIQGNPAKVIMKRAAPQVDPEPPERKARSAEGEPRPKRGTEPEARELRIQDTRTTPPEGSP